MSTFKNKPFKKRLCHPLSKSNNTTKLHEIPFLINQHNPSFQHINEIPYTNSSIYFHTSATSIASIDTTTLNKYFNYDKNVVVLSGPKLKNKKICFSPTPLHLGSNIIISNQHKDFTQDFNNLMMFEDINKNCYQLDSEYYNNFIIVCDKIEFMQFHKKYCPDTHLHLASISNNTPRHDYHQDQYIVLLIATNHDQHNGLCIHQDYFDKIKQLRKPNMTGNGTKHNQSYGSYYGFGIINTSFINNGISFGLFKNYSRNNKHFINHHQMNYFKLKFSSIVTSLNNKFPDLVTAGNSLISSLIDYGRNKCNNPAFHYVTSPFNYLGTNSYSGWICFNARTENFHQELDASYTLISIPYIESKNKQSSAEYKFQF